MHGRSRPAHGVAIDFLTGPKKRSGHPAPPVYAQLAELHDVAVADGLPADLVARRIRCVLLSQLGCHEERALHDRGAFKTPTLREIARSAPYMHDGSLGTLEAVVGFYSDGGRSNPGPDPQIRPRDFSPAETGALVAFLRALTGRVREGV